MDDLELDRGLAKMKGEGGADPGTSALLEELVMQSRAGKMGRRPLGMNARIAMVVGGFMLAGALAAGVTFQDYLLSIPPFAGLEDGAQRPTAGLTMTQEYGQDAGKRCVVYPEFRNLSPEQLRTVSDYVEAEKSWEALGSQAAAAAGVTPGEPEDDARLTAYYDALTALIHVRMQQVLPGIPFRARFTVVGGVEADPPSFEGWTISCIPGEADAQ